MNRSELDESELDESELDESELDESQAWLATEQGNLRALAGVVASEDAAHVYLGSRVCSPELGE